MITFYFSSARSVSFPLTLSRSPSPSLSLFCRFPLHSALLSHDQHPHPDTPPPFSFSHSLFSSFCRLGEEVVNRPGLHLRHCLTVCPFVQALLGQLPIHTALPIRTPFREYGRGHEMRSVTPAPPPPPPPRSSPHCRYG